MDAQKAIPADLYARRLANKEGIKSQLLKQKGEKVVKALTKNGFAAMFVEDCKQAREEMLKLIPGGATVGVGGSITIREIDILGELSQRGHTIYDHWKPGLSQEDILDIRRAHLTCDVFLTSANALTLDGELVNAEGIGNRVCAMIFGPKKVIIAVGANKIVKDVHAALRRIKEVAAPQALSGTGLAVPCVETGICNDCDSPMRGCRITTIMERRPMITDCTVLVIGEPAGF